MILTTLMNDSGNHISTLEMDINGLETDLGLLIVRMVGSTELPPLFPECAGIYRLMIL